MQNNSGKRAIPPLTISDKEHMALERKKNLVNDWKESKPIQNRAIEKAIAQAKEHSL